MSSSLSSLVDNLSEGLHSDKCTDCKSCLDYMVFKNYQLIFRCFECKTIYKKDFNKNLIKRFVNMHEFCNGDINKFILLLRKGVYPYEYMDSWERFEETSQPDREAFYSSLNMEDITDVDYRHAKSLLKYFNNKNLGDYHDLYAQGDFAPASSKEFLDIQATIECGFTLKRVRDMIRTYSDTLLLADVFENFRNKCVEIYEVDPAHFLSAPRLAWQACLKKTEVKLELLTNVDLLLMVEKRIRGGICHTIHRYAKAINKYFRGRKCLRNKVLRFG